MSWATTVSASGRSPPAARGGAAELVAGWLSLGLGISAIGRGAGGTSLPAAERPVRPVLCDPLEFAPVSAAEMTTESPLQHAYRLLNRPYYIFRPAQLVRRLRTGDPTGEGLSLQRTAWGSRLWCWPDPLGLAVARNGVYDLAVAETLARLAAPGERAVDAGANVGLMSGLLAQAVGPDGEVLSFEPHPLIFETLRRNTEMWASDPRLAPVHTVQAGVSDRAAVLPLAIDPETFARNKGTASLQEGVGDPAHAVEVQTVRLDERIDAPVGVMKLDVEMHELAALQGAERALAQGLIRDIVFEEHEPPPTAVTDLLQAAGYTVLGASQGMLGPVLTSAEDAYRRQLWDPPALIATRDPGRVRSLMRPRGWRCLRARLGRGG